MRRLAVTSMASLYAVSLWAPIGLGGNRPVPLAIIQLGVLSSLLAWVLAMIAARRLEWRRTALDLPLVLLIGLVLLQLALGNRPLVEWALAGAPPESHLPVTFPRGPLVLGTVSRADTTRSLLLFLTYVAVYVLVVNLVRTRRQIDRLVRTLLLLGGLLAFLGLLDYLVGEAWVFRWRDFPFPKRVSGPFINPDHFAAWLVMLICLGIGYLLARSRGDRVSLDLWNSRRVREDLVRRHLPFVGVAVMALALVFTLSRGGIVGLLAALVFLLVVQGVRGRARRSQVLVGALLAVTVGYGAWIGLGPLLARLDQGRYADRVVQSLTTLPMLGAFPVLGVGLGAYKEIYSRYQPAELLPGRVYFEFAHNDLLELVVETGVLGAATVVFAIWRVGTDLLMGHLLGRGRCPVGGGEDDGAERREPFSVGVGLGALAGIVALLVHSAFDFAARMPANGILAATCLGIATATLHTRFGPGGARLLTAVRVRTLGASPRTPALARATAIGVSLIALWWVVRPVLVAAELRWAGPATIERADRVLMLAPGDAEALQARADVRIAAARRIWASGRTPAGRTLTSWPERRAEALPLLDQAITDLRAALAVTPTSPYLHEQLGWAQETAAMIDPVRRASNIRAAVASLQRAVLLEPENPDRHTSLALVGLACGEPCRPLALAAARTAVQKNPSCLPDLVTQFLPDGLSDAQWASLVPDSGLDRLELGMILETAGLDSAAADEYRRAALLLGREEGSLARWKLARLLASQGDRAGALAAIQTALRHEPEQAELRLTLATILAQDHDPAALDAYRAAVQAAEARSLDTPAGDRPFDVGSARARALADRALAGEARDGLSRYRRALAWYLVDRGLWAQALTEWDLVLAHASGHAEDHFGRGRALEGLGREADALAAYRRAVALDERAVSFRLRLAQKLWESEQYYQAMNEWRRVVAQEPGNIGARLALAAGYVRMGQRAEAAHEYAQILQLAPDEPEARKRLSVLRGGPGG